MVVYGYIRTSTRDQNAALQKDAMTAAGIEHLYCDEGVSGTLASREQLDLLRLKVNRGDEVVVWKLDRIGRNTRNVLELIDEFTTAGVAFRSLTEGITTAGAMGRAMLTIMSAFAELERDTISERTRAGLESARAKGRVGGRPSVIDEQKLTKMKKLIASGDYTRAEIADMLKISPATLYRAISNL